MKKLFIILILISNVVFSQEKNQFNQLIVTKVVFKSYNNEESFSIEYFYSDKNLCKMIKKYTIGMSDYSEEYNIDEDKSIINVTHYENNKKNDKIVHYFKINNLRVIESETYVNKYENYESRSEFKYNKFLELVQINRKSGLIDDEEKYINQYNLYWDRGKIVKDELIINNDFKHKICSSYFYDNNVENNTNINMNFLIGTSSKPLIVESPIFTTEWAGRIPNFLIYTNHYNLKNKRAYNEARLLNGIIENVASVRKDIIKDKPYGYYFIFY